MKNKIFISVLGTNRYLKARYYRGAEKTGNEPIVHFVQEATIRNTCKDWNKEDKVIIFLTDEARNKNWNDPNQNNYQGLRSTLENLGYSFSLVDKWIPDGLSENEIWDIFKIVFDSIDEDSEIYFDITHAFRSLPMLVMVLINYAKFLKNSSVQGIYYGAFEKLGPKKIAEAIAEEERFVPILDLTSFSELQDWTAAASAFISFGNADRFEETCGKRINPLLKETKGQDQIAAHIRQLSKKLISFTRMMQTNRGPEIYEGKIAEELRESVQQVCNDPQLIVPMRPLLDKVENSIDHMNEKESVENLFRAVKWCLKYNLIQQAYSLLREAVITWILFRVFPDDFENYYRSENKRELVTGAIKIKSRNLPYEKWGQKAKEHKPLVDKIMAGIENETLINEFEALGDYRNDIMHSGFREKMKKQDKFYKMINKSLNNIIDALNIQM